MHGCLRDSNVPLSSFVLYIGLIVLYEELVRTPNTMQRKGEKTMGRFYLALPVAALVAVVSLLFAL